MNVGGTGSVYRAHIRANVSSFPFFSILCIYQTLSSFYRRHRQRTNQRRPNLTYMLVLFYFSILRFRQLQFTSASSLPPPPLPLLLLLFYFSIVCTVFDMTHFAGTTTKTKFQDCDHCNYTCDRHQLCTLELLLCEQQSAAEKNKCCARIEMMYEIQATGAGDAVQVQIYLDISHTCCSDVRVRVCFCLIHKYSPHLKYTRIQCLFRFFSHTISSLAAQKKIAANVICATYKQVRIDGAAAGPQVMQSPRQSSLFGHHSSKFLEKMYYFLSVLANQLSMFVQYPREPN